MKSEATGNAGNPSFATLIFHIIHVFFQNHKATNDSRQLNRIPSRANRRIRCDRTRNGRQVGFVRAPMRLELGSFAHPGRAGASALCPQRHDPPPGPDWVRSRKSRARRGSPTPPRPPTASLTLLDRIGFVRAKRAAAPCEDMTKLHESDRNLHDGFVRRIRRREELASFAQIAPTVETVGRMPTGSGAPRRALEIGFVRAL